MKKAVHLNALRALEASARHQSFSAAADELNVTPAAVGQLVRSLEDAVGLLTAFLSQTERQIALARLTNATLSKVDTSRGMQINNSAAVLQAVINGHGVALVRSVMARDDVAAGRLVRLFPEITFSSPLAYYVVYQAESAHMAKLKAFRDWLFAEVSSTHESDFI